VPQCVAEMLAAREFNSKNKFSDEIVFGCVTTADEWLFMQLSDNKILIHSRKFYINELGEILGVFKWMIDKFNSL
jgi:hypothetical protein